MEQRGLDFEVEMSAAQWDELARRAETLAEQGGTFACAADEGNDIQLFLRPGDAPPLWRDFVGDGESYGADRREVARFHFNGGRPYAEIEADGVVEEPVYTAQEAQTMQSELERWVRGKWHELLRESGVHFERGHTSL